LTVLSARQRQGKTINKEAIMAKDKKKNDTAKKTAPKKDQSKKQNIKAGKDADKKADKGAKKGGPVTEKKPNIFSKLFTYLVEVRAELKRVTWPTREKVVYLVGVVVVTLLFFAVFTATVDWGSSEGIIALNNLTETEREPINNEIPVEIDLDSLGLGEGDATEEGIVTGDGGAEIELETDLTDQDNPDDADGAEE